MCPELNIVTEELTALLLEHKFLTNVGTTTPLSALGAQQRMGERDRGLGRRERRGPSPILRVNYLTAFLGAVHECVVPGLTADAAGVCEMANPEQAESSNRSRGMRLVSTTEEVC